MYYDSKLLLPNVTSPQSLYGFFPGRTIEQPIVPVPTELMDTELSAHEESVQKRKSYVEISAHGMTLKITEDTESSLIAKVLGVLAHVK